MKVVFREEAIADLEAIADYVSKQDPVAAARVVTRIHRVIYGTFAPCLWVAGSIRQTTLVYAVPGLPYLIVYLPSDNTIDILGVFHTSRDPATKPQP